MSQIAVDSCWDGVDKTLVFRASVLEQGVCFFVEARRRGGTGLRCIFIGCVGEGWFAGMQASTHCAPG